MVRRRVAGLVLASVAVAGAAGMYLTGDKVASVTDGDTFRIENKQPIRLYGVDAPEVENCMGPEAKRRLTALILSKRVMIRQPYTDPWRRVMALVYVDGKLVNEIMVREGLAEYSGLGRDEAARMGAANSEARANKRGIFSERCYQKDPPDLKCPIKGNITLNVKTYYLPDCGH